MRTPPKRAPYRSGLAGTVRDRSETRQVADHITMSDREVRGERARSRLIARPSGPDGAAAGRELGETFFHPRGNTDMSLRWVYVHMIEEYARHNAHADLLRERIDGARGY